MDNKELAALKNNPVRWRATLEAARLEMEKIRQAVQTYRQDHPAAPELEIPLTENIDTVPLQALAPAFADPEWEKNKKDMIDYYFTNKDGSMPTSDPVIQGFNRNKDAYSVTVNLTNLDRTLEAIRRQLEKLGEQKKDAPGQAL